MPDNNKMLTIENWQKRQLNPFVVYADLEAIDVAAENNIPNPIEIEREYPDSFDAILDYSSCRCF